jgi:hypothetical protein
MTGEMADTNILGWVPLLIKEKDHLKNIQSVMGCPRKHVGLQSRQETIRRLLEASALYRRAYAITAAILQGPKPKQ